MPPGHPLLGGGEGALHRASRAIYISNTLAPELAAFVEAHEFGHYWIETPDDPAIVPRKVDPGVPEEATPLGLRRVEAYSAQELRERYANVFAREFLLPRSAARRLFADEGKSAPGIAHDLNVPIGLVHQQLAAALLLPESPQSTEDGAEPGERPGLDDSQREAAEHEGSPLLVEAGPGTGKTRTLIARTEFLLTKKGVPAPSILALTFSNKAAREIRERVAATMPGAAAELWAGTFHAFGLEILRKFGHLANVAEPVRLLDQADVLAMLERDLPQLGLDHYLLLHEPLLNLRYVLGSISRAKDEVKSPDDYAAAAGRMAETARTEDDQLKAAKAAEVARVYRHYDERMRGQGIVDFADLINRPVEILRAHPEVRDELRGQYQHLLIDEYQDVNRASALLVKELASEGERLWVVGDTRQSIYRFRGAAPINTRDFEKDYPNGQRKPLKVNYRSRKEIVDTFGAYAGSMKVRGPQSAVLEAKRGTGAQAVDCNVARDRDAEIAGIAAAIEHHRSQGTPYRDQAVLCRVHSNLEKIALGLEVAGVPVLYLGDLFERPEVSDLLALLSFTAEPHRGGLYRVAELVPYRTSLADVRLFLAYAEEVEKRPLDALADIREVPGLSDSGRISLGRLAEDLATIGYKTGPGSVLCHLLFNRGALLRDLLVGDTAADQQRRLAIHQFLQFAIENETVEDGDPKCHLLDWVRRLEIFGDERALREPPAAIEGIDAVRLMTVHASKGLEFKVVHLPTLGAGMFPLRRQGQRCPLPDGMLPTDPSDDHEEEEECLFYVALSRAQDHLSLSRAQRYSAKQRSNASKALSQIVGHLPRFHDSEPTWTASLPLMDPAGDRPDLRVQDLHHDGRDIEVFLGCPRRYLYQIVLGLSGDREDNGYVRFHRAVYRVLRWMGGQATPVGADPLTAEFEAAWHEIGPHDHPLEALYRASAKRILDQALGRLRDGIEIGRTLDLKLDGHTIALPIDELEGSGEGFVLRRIRTGRPPSRLDKRHLHAMMLAAGRQNTPGACRFELQYLTTNDTVPVSLDGVMDGRLDDIRQALRDAAAGRYPPTPNDGCPRCPHYFICPAAPI
ncbi:MAG: ATP-dependent helicase [Rhodospirillaceae bacterium]|nr:ATP-dependent helicase [Rhodospirillaceae bacterium]